MTTPTKTEFESAIALTLSKGVFYADIGKNSTVMDKKLLDILCCPASKQSLLLLSKDQIECMNAAITAGKVVQLDGQTINKPLKEALMTRDGKLLYRIDDGIPVLLAEEAIAVASIDGFAA